MDRILLVDFMFFLWRSASIGFSPTKRKIKKTETIAENNDGFQDFPSASETQELLEETEEDPTFIIAYNFFRGLRPLIELFQPNQCFLVLEGHPHFRYQLFADYKANRKIIKQASTSAAKLTNQELVFAAKDEVLRLCRMHPFTTARSSYYECDDVIGSLCENLKQEKLTVITNDSDYLQLLQRNYQNLTIYNPIKKAKMTTPEVPYIAFKSLIGDKSDNIPGLVSEKKAIKLLTDPPSFKKFMDNTEQRAKFNINRQLIEFQNVSGEEIDMIHGSTDFSSLKEEFRRMKFESIINDVSWEKYTNTFNCLKF